MYEALCTGQRHLALGTNEVRYFPSEVSPFAGFAVAPPVGFAQLHQQLPVGHRLLYASQAPLGAMPLGWQLRHHIPGLQFIHKGTAPAASAEGLVPLGPAHVADMLALTRLTRPGPFGPRTIEFGGYYGIFENGQLVAMSGLRLQIPPFTEISAVCTHPQHLGRGYASRLLAYQLHQLCAAGQVPFLHVRADNVRAIDVYQRLGFQQSRNMHFYFFERL